MYFFLSKEVKPCLRKGEFAPVLPKIIETLFSLIKKKKKSSSEPHLPASSALIPPRFNRFHFYITPYFFLPLSSAGIPGAPIYRDSPGSQLTVSANFSGQSQCLDFSLVAFIIKKKIERSKQWRSEEKER